MRRGLKRLKKAQLVTLVKELRAEVALLKTQVGGKEDEGVWVIESLSDGFQFFPHTSDPERPDLVIPPYESLNIDEEWLHHPGLRRNIAAGLLKTPWREKEPPIPLIRAEVPEHLRLTLPVHEATVGQILNRPVKEILPYINIQPRGLRGTTDVRYLKDTMLPILQNALYRAEHGEGRPGQRGSLLRALKKRIKHIREL